MISVSMSTMFVRHVSKRSSVVSRANLVLFFVCFVDRVLVFLFQPSARLPLRISPAMPLVIRAKHSLPVLVVRASRLRRRRRYFVPHVALLRTESPPVRQRIAPPPRLPLLTRELRRDARRKALRE